MWAMTLIFPFCGYDFLLIDNLQETRIKGTECIQWILNIITIHESIHFSLFPNKFMLCKMELIEERR